ncbi:hypothetical protein FJY94_03540 [Candidatus Kaiserbacteria bacterium]|nr:hypothetical protein [Candidatus Kaiserbacteria bacterium]
MNGTRLLITVMSGVILAGSLAARSVLAQEGAHPAAGPLCVHPDNPRCFTNGAAMAPRDDLGDMYPAFAGGVNGVKDSHPYLAISPSGLHDPDQPTWGGWGGRFGGDGPQYFSTVEDTVVRDVTARGVTSLRSFLMVGPKGFQQQSLVGEWRDAFFADDAMTRFAGKPVRRAAFFRTSEFVDKLEFLPSGASRP